MAKLFFIKNIKIGSSMLVFYQILSIALIVIFVVFMVMLHRLHLITNKILTENVSSIRAAYNVEISLLNLKGLKANYILEEDEKWLRFFDENEKSFTYWYNEAFNSAKTEDERNLLSAMALDFEKYMKIHTQIISLFKNTKRTAAINLLLDESNESFDAINLGCANLIKKNESLIRDSEKIARDYLARAQYFGYTVIVLFMAIGILVAITISNSILSPIQEMERDGDAVLRMVGDGKKDPKNEVERLKDRFQRMIDALKANQQKLVQSEKRAAIGAVVAGISHELNNPIGIIYGFAERLLKSKAMNVAQKTDVREIYQEAERCKKLLGELLDFARPMQFEFVPGDVKKLIRDSVKLFEYQEKYKGVRFEVEVPYKAGKVHMDYSRIKQVLINIILNAADAMGNKGLVRITLVSESKNLLIKIRDNGQGVKLQDLEEIFKPFYSTKPKGVGLGLSICQDIIERHGGSITVDSKLGAFTEFTIILPKRP